MTGELIAREDLSVEQRRRMLELLGESFSEVTAERFARDLAEKNAVVMILNGAREIVGFSTILMYETVFEGERIAVIYSGDTIVSRAAWGSPALPRTWIGSVWALHEARFAGLPLYWLLLTGGFRTYRFLSVFWREFYPRAGVATPARMARMLEQVAGERFGGQFDRAAGVVRLGQPLQGELLEVPESRLEDADVAFFLARNPGYVHGDEMVCIAPLTRENLTAAGWRMVRPANSAHEGVVR